jgi:uncharacterized membrane protein
MTSIALHAKNDRSVQPSTGAFNIGYNERMAGAIGGPLLALYGLTRGTPAGLVLAAGGGYLFYRSLTGHCPIYQSIGITTARGADEPVHAEKSVIINRPAEDLYSFWRNFAQLPRFMKHLEAVRVNGDRRSHWVARGPAGTRVEWDAEITADRPNELIAWRSLEGADVHNSGTVRFDAAPGGRGTVLHVALDYRPPAGALGAAVAQLFGEAPQQQIEGDLRRFKNIMEAGEIPTTSGQPTGQRSAIGKLLTPEQPEKAESLAATPPHKPVQPKKPPVQEASEESFPASDPPAWSGTTAGNNEREVGG